MWNLVANSSKLQLIIVLGLHGYLPAILPASSNPSIHLSGSTASALPVSSRMRIYSSHDELLEFKDIQNSWDTGEYLSIEFQDLTWSTLTSKRLSNGVLAVLATPNPSAENATPNPQRSIFLYRLPLYTPSLLDKNSKTHARGNADIHPFAEFPATGFVVEQYIWDENQDLFLLATRPINSFVRTTFRFKSILTSGPHSLAKRSEIELPGRVMSRKSIQIVGATVITCYRFFGIRRTRHLLALDWKSGEVLYVIENAHGFAVLDDDIIVTAVIENNDQRALHERVYLLLINIHDGGPLLKLLLPFSQPPDTISFIRGDPIIESRDDNARDYADGNWYQSGSRAGKFFEHDPKADRVAVLRFKWSPGDALCSFVSLSKILRLFLSPGVVSSQVTSTSTSTTTPASAFTSSTLRVLSWNEWGPSCTRMFQDDIMVHTYSICGSRVALTTRCEDLLRYSANFTGKYPEKCPLVFMDFNQRLIQKQGQISFISETRSRCGVEEMPRMKTITEAWKMSCSMADDDIQSSLPFRILVSENLEGNMRPALGTDHFVAEKTPHSVDVMHLLR